jgi:NADH-ubiquinone oxidoreductase chain 5
MAGMAALKETDIKKVVALSTLSQLGVIMTTMGAGLWPLAFFHLLSHAYFKALLFITVGAIIHLSRDYQDLRKVRLVRNTCPTILAFRLGANLSLCGIPFSRGFFSKDACIELFVGGTRMGSLRIVFYLATALTAAYTARLLILCTRSQDRAFSSIWSNDRDPGILSSILGLFPLALIGGGILSWLLFSSPLNSPLSL